MWSEKFKTMKSLNVQIRKSELCLIKMNVLVLHIQCLLNGSDMQKCADLFSPEEDKCHTEGELCRCKIQICRTDRTSKQAELRHLEKYLNE